MTYSELIASHIRKNGGDDVLIAAVRAYLENAHPHDEPPWCVEFDNICQAAVAYASAKKERPRKHKKRTAFSKDKSPAPNRRHRQSLAQERHAIRLGCASPIASLYTEGCLGGSKN